MALEGLRGYLELANALTEASRQRAKEVALSLVPPTALEHAVPPLSKQAQQVAEDIVATSRTNRALLLGLVRGEVERAAIALGVPVAADMRRLERRVARLEEKVADDDSPVRARARKAAATTAAASKAAADEADVPATAARRAAATGPTAAKATARRQTPRTSTSTGAARPTTTRKPAPQAAATTASTRRAAPRATRPAGPSTTPSSTGPSTTGPSTTGPGGTGTTSGPDTGAGTGTARPSPASGA